MRRIRTIGSAVVSVLLVGCSGAGDAGHRNVQRAKDTRAVVNQAEKSLAGSYQYSNGSEVDDISIAAVVSKVGRQWELTFQGAHPDGSGAAPDGGGTGWMDAGGMLHFTYEDSFSNRGTAAFRRTAKGYELSIIITDVGDPRCLMFYGEFTVQRAGHS